MKGESRQRRRRRAVLYNIIYGNDGRQWESRTERTGRGGAVGTRKERQRKEVGMQCSIYQVEKSVLSFVYSCTEITLLVTYIRGIVLSGVYF